MENDKITTQLKSLDEKYSLTGQDLSANLEGLLHADYLRYWDYIHVDTLLTLQKPRTNIPDELIFIGYHQITELYFKLILWEMEQISNQKDIKSTYLLDKMQRICRYMGLLVQSFDVMVDGMDVKQFKQFRMALLPASGFQSAQFRMIEVCSTDFRNLVNKDFRPNINENTTFEQMYEHVYWKQGATETATGKRTITLEHFEIKYAHSLQHLANDYKNKNLWQKFLEIKQEDENFGLLRELYRKYDRLVNIEWAMAHLRSAGKYLTQQRKNTADTTTETVAVPATGGTNWTKYLPPRHQKRIYFPELWNEEEKENWGM